MGDDGSEVLASYLKRNRQSSLELRCGCGKAVLRLWWVALTNFYHFEIVPEDDDLDIIEECSLSLAVLLRGIPDYSISLAALLDEWIDIENRSQACYDMSKSSPHRTIHRTN